LAAAAFSCCAIERTRTDDERDEREEEEDEIVVAANDDDEDAKPRRRRGPGERATAEAPPRRGAAGAADDEAHAQAGPREDARERDDAVIAIVRTRKKLDKERGKKERRKSVWSSVSRFRRARLSLKPRKKLSSRLNEISLPLFSRSRSISLFLWVHAPLSPANHAGREDDAPDQLAAVLPLEGQQRPGVDTCPLVIVGRCATTRASPSSPSPAQSSAPQMSFAEAHSALGVAEGSKFDLVSAKNRALADAKGDGEKLAKVRLN